MSKTKQSQVFKKKSFLYRIGPSEREKYSKQHPEYDETVVLIAFLTSWSTRQVQQENVLRLTQNCALFTLTAGQQNNSQRISRLNPPPFAPFFFFPFFDGTMEICSNSGRDVDHIFSHGFGSRRQLSQKVHLHAEMLQSDRNGDLNFRCFVCGWWYQKLSD